MANTKVTVEQAIAEGERIISRHPGYDMGNRIGPDTYDCSGFMATIWGLVDIYGVAPDTASMVAEYPKYGFEHYSYGSVSLKKGDILLYTAIYSETGGIIEYGHTVMIYDDSISHFIESYGGHGPGIRGIWPGRWTDVLRGSGGLYIDKWLPTDGSRGFHH